MVYLFSRSFSATLAFFFSGILLDLDHIFEYIYKFGPAGFSLKKFFRAAHNHEYGRYFLLIHSYELAAVFWLLSLVFIRRPWAWGIALGLTLHLVADQIYNPCQALTYFLIYRLRHRFDGDTLFPPEKREKEAHRRRKKGAVKTQEGSGPGA